MWLRELASVERAAGAGSHAVAALGGGGGDGEHRFGAPHAFDRSPAFGFFEGGDAVRGRGARTVSPRIRFPQATRDQRRLLSVHLLDLRVPRPPGSWVDPSIGLVQGLIDGLTIRTHAQIAIPRLLNAVGIGIPRW